MSRPMLEVADVFRRHGPAWRAANAGHISLAQRRVMTAIEACRTAALGGHVERCEDCAHTRPRSARSCPRLPNRLFADVRARPCRIDPPGGAADPHHRRPVSRRHLRLTFGQRIRRLLSDLKQSPKQPSSVRG